VTLPGTLRANQQVTLHAKVAGHVKTIAVDTGDAVQAGQLDAGLGAQRSVQIGERLVKQK
jgi:multidrug efflux pump subunit AcrA (membrane-fusion protein)